MTLQQLEQAFISFRTLVTGQIQGLYIKVSDIEKKQNECKPSLHIKEYNGYFFNPDNTTNDLFLIINDLFPLDGICIDEKAILVLNDSTLYLRFASEFNNQDITSGWQIITYSTIGKDRK